jgi:hypothetical protein
MISGPAAPCWRERGVAIRAMMRAMSEALGARCDLHQRTVPRADGDVKMRTPIWEATTMNKTRRTFTVVAAGYLK